jgi:hypothetical protein
VQCGLQADPCGSKDEKYWQRRQVNTDDKFEFLLLLILLLSSLIDVDVFVFEDIVVVVIDAVVVVGTNDNVGSCCRN